MTDQICFSPRTNSSPSLPAPPDTPTTNDRDRQLFWVSAEVENLARVMMASDLNDDSYRTLHQAIAVRLRDLAELMLRLLDGAEEDAAETLRRLGGFAL